MSVPPRWTSAAGSLRSAPPADNVSLTRWWALFAAYLLVLAVAALWMLAGLGRPWQDLLASPGEFHSAGQQALKLLLFMLYLSLCTGFVPLPGSWMVAAIATQEVALAPNLPATVLLVATAGAAASTMGNLNDYHLYTLLLRTRRAERVRDTAAVRFASGWFARAPFTLLMMFGILPIPIDVARMLAAATRYPLGLFAGANFLGRFVRYMILAAVAYASRVGAADAAAVMVVAAALVVGAKAIAVVGRRRRVPQAAPAESFS
ncbi:MAG: hypothetical protein GX591_01205 [Planctomycetes bacterium]|nr:hypothetical protein [Planctomycetota bacterium]